jgi:hypothetical protein
MQGNGEMTAFIPLKFSQQGTPTRKCKGPCNEHRAIRGGKMIRGRWHCAGCARVMVAA